MKALARSYIWWPDLDKEIEDKVHNCELQRDCSAFEKATFKLLWPYFSTDAKDPYAIWTI